MKNRQERLRNTFDDLLGDNEETIRHVTSLQQNFHSTDNSIVRLFCCSVILHDHRRIMAVKSREKEVRKLVDATVARYEKAS